MLPSTSCQLPITNSGVGILKFLVPGCLPLFLLGCAHDRLFNVKYADAIEKVKAVQPSPNAFAPITVCERVPDQSCDVRIPEGALGSAVGTETRILLTKATPDQIRVHI